jgi:hypothetical protein
LSFPAYAPVLDTQPGYDRARDLLTRLAFGIPL